MNKQQIDRLRQLPIEGVAERLGIRVTRHKALCPFHDDHHASLSFHTGRNTCRCFVCMDKSMGTIDLAMRALGRDFRQACQWLGDKEQAVVSLAPTCSRASWPEPREAEATIEARYGRFFEHPWLSEPARRFLFEERRLSPKVVRWCRLTSWTDHGGTPWLQTPYYDLQGQLVGVQNRRLAPEPASQDSGGGAPAPGGAEGAKPRFRFPRGAHCSIYGLPVLAWVKPGGDVFITEGCSDCWAMLSSGRAAIAVPSATLLGQDGRELLLSVTRKKGIRWHMYPDRDAPGERLFLQLRSLLPDIRHHQLPPGCKDFAEAFARENMEIKKQHQQ